MLPGRATGGRAIAYQTYMTTKTFILSMCLTGLLVCGCVEPIPAPPHTLAEYSEIQRTHPQEYASSTVMRHNIQRVLDPDLSTDQRVASLDLISSLVGPNGKLPAEVSIVLTQSDCPETLRKSILNRGVGVATVTNRTPPVGVSKGGAGRLALSELARAPAGPRRTATLRWLVGHPRREVLPDLTKLWASEAPNGPDEQLFRQAMAKLGPGKWQDVLLDSLNAKKFAARGSALSVLSGRGAEIDLLNRIKRMPAKTVSVQAMQTFGEKFGYVPANGGELLACVILHASGKDALNAPARLSGQWGAKYKYKFNIRDFHLISNLATDPVRGKIGRDQLVKQIVAKLARRKHVTGGSPFSKQAARMTMPDLWNIVLLDEMLRRQRVSLALRILADRLRAGLSSPRSGLVFYEGGRASAKLYPQSIDSTRGDRDHIPERELQRAGFSALAHLHTRFETVYNGDRAPASKREVSASGQGNYYGLVLTSIDSGTFSGFYYNPDGAVVSLGMFAFGK
ncbi:MAG: hypothetical protein QGH60_03110 [Phycisphaerae bacterium]|jgi:hypothetical protein|nr:hypothetical protein [Phycisphaerae bacterium]